MARAPIQKLTRPLRSIVRGILQLNEKPVYIFSVFCALAVLERKLREDRFVRCNREFMLLLLPASPTCINMCRMATYSYP